VCDSQNNLPKFSQVDMTGREHWFSRSLARKMGNGSFTRLWLVVWTGSVPLNESFPRLYSISEQKKGTVSEVRMREHNI